jgi:hypothetical protein
LQVAGFQILAPAFERAFDTITWPNVCPAAATGEALECVPLPRLAERVAQAHPLGGTCGAEHLVTVDLGPVDKPDPEADASERDEAEEAGGGLVISGGDAPLFFEMRNEALNA